MINFAKTLRVNLQATDAPKKTYAIAQVREAMSLQQFAKHISDHNSKYCRADVAGVLMTAVDCLIEQVKNGNSVCLGDLGTFLPVIKSKGVCESVPDEETGEKPIFTAADINKVTIGWHKGLTLKNFVGECTFTEVLTVKARQDALKAKKAQIAEGTYDPIGNGNKSDDGGGEQQP